MPNGVRLRVKVTKYSREPFEHSQLCTEMGVTVPELTDEEIVARIRAGEPGLFEILVRRHNQRLYRATRAILKDVAEAEDVMQEAYVRAFVHLQQFAGEARFSTWLTKIAIYEALARLRRRKHMDDMPEQVSSGVDLEHAAYRKELRSLIEAAIDVLPPAYRTVFVLRDIEQMSGAEAAEYLGITEETAKTRLHRARRMLRDELKAAVGDSLTQIYSYGSEHCDRMTDVTMERIRRCTKAGDPSSPSV